MSIQTEQAGWEAPPDPGPHSQLSEGHGYGVRAERQLRVAWVDDVALRRTLAELLDPLYQTEPIFLFRAEGVAFQRLFH